MLGRDAAVDKPAVEVRDRQELEIEEKSNAALNDITGMMEGMAGMNQLRVIGL